MLTHVWPRITDTPGTVVVTNPTDAELVEACLAGRRDAFDTIVERHRRQIYQLCFRFVDNHEDASDLAQDVFVRAYRGLHRFKGRASLATWLYRIGVNVCLNRVTARRIVTGPITERRLMSTAESPVNNLKKSLGTV